MVEKALYCGEFSCEDLINRCLRKRPLVFWNAYDGYLLRDGRTDGASGFESIGTASENPPLILADYLSYDEMQVSALIGVAVPTHFINNGSRENQGRPGMPGSFEERGVYVGLVGARFEKPNVVEWQHMIVTKQQSTKENGYGPDADREHCKTQMLQAWARFYGDLAGEVPFFFPTFAQALDDKSGRFIRLNHLEFLDSLVYKIRISLVVGPFLEEANDRAKKEGKTAYIVAVGLGLGVWKISPQQTGLMLEVYSEYISSHELPFISDINFTYFGGNDLRCGEAMHDENITDVSGHQIRVLFTRGNPADKIDGHGQILLVAMYAW